MSDVELPVPGAGWPDGYYPPQEVFESFGYPVTGDGTPLPGTVTVTVSGTQARIDVDDAQPGVEYSIDWGDGGSPTTGRTNSGGKATAVHNYNDPGSFTITVTNRADDSLIGTEDVTVPG